MNIKNIGKNISEQKVVPTPLTSEVASEKEGRPHSPKFFINDFNFNCELNFRRTEEECKKYYAS